MENICRGCILKVDWSEFLKNRDGKESADRLLLLLSFPFATALALKIGTTEALGVYLAAYGALAVNNKWADRHANTAKILEADSNLPRDDNAIDYGVSKRKSRVRSKGD